MLAPRIPRTVMRAKRQPRPGDSRKHLDFIRSLPCCVYGTAPPSDAHHLLKADNLPKGTGRRSLDRWTVPLGHRAHIEGLHGHGNEEAWFVSKGIDARALAAALWRVSGDEEAALRILERARPVKDYARRVGR